jgi:hypothetical protein
MVWKQDIDASYVQAPTTNCSLIYVEVPRKQPQDIDFK